MVGTNPIDHKTSQTIRMTRVLCIFFMMLVHVPPGFDNYLRSAMQDPGIFFFLQAFFTGVVGRSSVPLLSIVSGFLAVYSLSKTGFFRYSVTRLNTLYTPLIFWNLLMLAFALAAFSLIGARTRAYDAVESFGIAQLIIGAIMTLDDTGITEPLKFLRDLFVCGLFLPALIFLARKVPFSSLLVLLVISSFGLTQPIIFRPAILIFFYLGVILQVSGGEKTFGYLERNAKLIFAFFIVVCIVFGLQLFNYIEKDAFRIGPTDAFVLIKQLVVATSMWCFGWWLIQFKSAQFLLRFESVAFLVYLSHAFVFGIAWFVWKQVFSAEINLFYSLFFFGAPMALFFAAPLLHAQISRLPQFAQVLIKGKASKPPAKSVQDRRNPFVDTLAEELSVGVDSLPK